MASTTWLMSADEPFLHLLHQLGDIRHAGFPGQRQKAALDQVLLVGGKVETGEVL
jgi:hypothetical protein